jgi:hypothetical protein
MKEPLSKRRLAKEDHPNQGVLLLDATCASADVAYPTNLDLLNEAREKLENIIDTLHAPMAGQARQTADIPGEGAESVPGRGQTALSKRQNHPSGDRQTTPVY